MRRVLLTFLLTLSLAAASQTTPASSSNSSAKLRQAADTLLATGSGDDAVKAADLLDKASQIDNREEAANNNGWFARLSPTLSVFAVVLGYWLTDRRAALADQERRQEAAQKRRDDQEEAERKRVAEERQRFTDAVTLIQKSEDFSPAAAVLSTFAAGPYAEAARQAAAKVLLHTKSFENFRDLFNSFVEPISRKNLDQVLDLFRSVSLTVGPLLNKSWINGDNDVTVFTPEERKSYDLLVPERIFLGNKTAAILRQPRETLEEIDLSSVGFDGCDLKGADLRNANIAHSTWNLVNLDDADLRGIVSFSVAYFYSTAWWHARYIEPSLLEYLIKEVPFSNGRFNTQKPVSEEEYAENVARLRAPAL